MAEKIEIAEGNSTWNQKLFQLIQCVVCQKSGQPLKQLTCQHVICLKCVSKMMEIPSHPENILCVKCRKETSVTCGADQLPDSMMANQLAGIIHNINPDTPLQPPPESSIVLEKLNCIITSHTESGQLRRNMEEKVKEIHQLIKVADSNETHVKELKEKLPEEFEQTKKKLEELQTKEGKALKKKLGNVRAASIKKIRAIERSRQEQERSLKSAINETEPKITKLRQIVDTAEEMLEGLKNDTMEGDDFSHITKTLEEMKSFKVKTAGLSEMLKAGDSVRLKLDSLLIDSVSKILEDNMDFNKIGRVISVDSRRGYNDGGSSAISVWFRGNKELWKGSSDHLIKSLTRSSLPYVGDRVFLTKKPPKSDKYGVNLKKHDEWYHKKITGTVIKVDKTYGHAMDAKVVFPGQMILDVNANHLERTENNKFEEGMEVMLQRGLQNPVRGFSGVTRSSFGVVLSSSGDDVDDDVTVDFPECYGWQGKVSEIEVARHPMAGEFVQPKMSVNLSENKWNGITREEFGKILDVTQRYTKARVRFGSKTINCNLKELDLAEPAEDEASENDAARAIFGQLMLRQAIAGLYDDDGYGPYGYGYHSWEEEESDEGF